MGGGKKRGSKTEELKELTSSDGTNIHEFKLNPSNKFHEIFCLLYYQLQYAKILLDIIVTE